MSARIRYRFSHRSDDGRTYYWYSRIPGDSRVEQVTCSVDWFWTTADPYYGMPGAECLIGAMQRKGYS